MVTVKIHQDMSKKIDKARYYPPETMPFILCVACLDMVLDHSDRSRKLYDRVMECHELTGCHDVMSRLEDEIPEGTNLLKRIVKESGYDYKKPPERENIGIPYMRGLLKCVFRSKLTGVTEEIGHSVGGRWPPSRSKLAGVTEST